MSRLIRLLILGLSLSHLCQAQEEKNVTQPQDKMTIDKAWEALLEEGELTFALLFLNLPKDTDSEIVDSKLTYPKALAALKAESKEVKRLSELVKEKRRILTKMIGSYAAVLENGKLQATPMPPYTRKQYDEAKSAYEKARDELRKIKAPSDERVLFRKAEKK